jgi:PQQ enzyme repeat
VALPLQGARRLRRLRLDPISLHQKSSGRLPRNPITIFPGDLGGVETPMALAANRLFVPWVDFAARANKLPSMDFGGATVANDVVFTSTYAGTVYAYNTQTGKTLWTPKAPAGINSFPGVGDTLLVGVGATGFFKKPQFQLIA